MYNIMTDFIPNQVRWITEILGVKGDSRLGMEQLKKYYDAVKTQPGRAQEAILIINLAYKLTWQEEQGLEFISTQDPQHTDNALAIYTWALSAAFCHDNDLALEKLNELQGRQTEVPFYAMMYLKGRCMLNSLDMAAEQPLMDYIEEYPGEDFKKDACHRLSLLHLIQGDTTNYDVYRSMVHVIGNNLRDRDQEAMIESHSTIIPHAGLLKARFLFDGGYYGKADSVINSIPEETLVMLPYRLEYHYRVGRIYQKLEREGPAIASLRMAAMAGAGQPYTFATRAALQLAIIFEGQGDHEQALDWYRKCLEYYDAEHTPGGVADMAEKGVKRVKSFN
jgi:tetratricopeptide (TPR) repeat protein